MFELFKLVGRVMVDSSGANQSLEQTDKKAQDATDGLGGYMDKLKGWAAAAAAALSASAIVKGLKEVWDISTQVAEIGDNIGKASQRAFMSTYSYQKWAYIAQRYGFDISNVSNAIYELTKKVGEGSDETLAYLEEIGISAEEALTATPEELFEKVIAGLQSMEDPARRAAVADKLLSGEAKNLTTAFNDSAEGTAALAAEFDKLDGAMSDELVKQSEAFADSKLNLQTAWDGVKYHLAENTLPGMTQIIDGLTQMLTGDFVGGLETAADGVASYLNGVLETVGGWASQIRAQIESALNIDLSIMDVPGFGSAQQEQEFFDSAMADFDTSASWDAFKSDLSSAVGGYWNTWTQYRDTQIFGGTDRSGKFANGLSFVPRDDYPARLHYGERVLTRQEAQAYNSGSSTGGEINIYIQSVAQSPAQEAAAVQSALKLARWSM